MPSTPGLPPFALTRFSASLRFSRSHTSSIRRSVPAGLSIPRSAASDSVPRSTAVGASPLLSAAKASSSWSFCRLSLTSRGLYSPLLSVWAFVRDVPGPASPAVSPLSGECPNRVDRLLTPTMPAADFCATIERPPGPPSPRRDTTQISRGKSRRLPRTAAGFTLRALDGYALRGQLPARPTLTPLHPVLVHRLALSLRASFRPRLAAAALALRYTLHLHQVGSGTLTPKLRDMLGTQQKPRKDLAPSRGRSDGSRRCPPRYGSINTLNASHHLPS
jgi:hypothetical protein